ncbi:MAG: GtrA family protein [Gallionella sp.]
MSRWQGESVYLGRYAGSGMLNTAVGFTVIFLLMWLGISPFIANIGGYLVGLILGFLVSRKFVFRSEGHISSEAIHYLATFLFCFALNLLVLKFVLDSLHWNANLAQLLAAAAYTAVMYLLTRWLVFTPHPEK